MTKEKDKDKKGKGKGFYEEPDPGCIGKDGKAKAKRHHEVAAKKEAGEALNKRMERKEAEKEELHIVIDPDKLLTFKGYCDENEIGFRIDETFDIREGVAVYITPPEAKAECDALLEFIEKNQVVEGVIEDEDNSTSSDLAPKVIGEKVVVFQHEKPIPQALLTDFCKEFNTELNEDENRKKISINRKDAGSLQEFMEEHGIEFEEIEDREMEEAHLATAEQVVSEVQGRRKESAKAIDSSRTAKNVGDKEDAEDLVDWVKAPGESDLAGVDTKGAAEIE